MWDAHFAYRVCDNVDIYLHEKFTCSNRFKIFSLDRKSGEKIVRNAKQVRIPELKKIPIYVDEVNTFSQTILTLPDNQQNVWPWTTETIARSSSSVKFIYDRECGYDDNFSIGIQSKEFVTARWIATTLGPAFGGQKFQDSKKYKLSAQVKTTGMMGGATVGIRLHREGVGSVFDIETYDLYFSFCKISGTSNWIEIYAMTPLISPVPDRIHLILQQSGIGKSRFDNVLFEVLT
jgi:hypothetical protein